MQSKTAIKKLVGSIWKHGELGNGNGCLSPSTFAKFRLRSEYNFVSDVLHSKYGATHFSRVWQIKGKFVRIQLWKREGFGACDGGEIVYTETVKVSKKEQKNAK